LLALDPQTRVTELLIRDVWKWRGTPRGVGRLDQMQWAAALCGYHQGFEELPLDVCFKTHFGAIDESAAAGRV
jgi:hypothetical protein